MTRQPSNIKATETDMTKIRTLLSAALLAAAVSGAQAQTAPAAKPDDHNAHHPADAPATPAPVAQPMPGGAMGSGMMGGGGMMGGNMDTMMQQMMPTMRMMMRGGMARMDDGAMPMMGARRIEGRIAFLKAELAITDAQLPQWNALAAILRANAKSMAERHAADTAGTAASAPDRADRMIAHMAARLEALKGVAGALRTLYGALSPEQRKTADELLTMGAGTGRM